MNIYIEKLRNYLTGLPLNCACTDANSLIEMLYYYYTSDNPINSAAIRHHFRVLDAQLRGLSLRENDAVIYAVSSICSEYERLAFLAGMQIGARLSTELRESGDIASPRMFP